MSVAGAWFFLMACEMFVLGNRDLRLPGLGSYLQTAANAGDTRAILWGLAVMVTVIVLIDQLVWRPIIAWSEKFKFEQVEAYQTPRSPILDFLRRSRILHRAAQVFVAPLGEAMALRFANAANVSANGRLKSTLRTWLAGAVATAGLLPLTYAIVQRARGLGTLSGSVLGGNLRGSTTT